MLVIIKSIIQFFVDMLSGGSKVSSMRSATMMTVAVVLGIFVAWNVKAMMIATKLEMIDFPQNAVMVLLIALGAKVGQHVSETVSGVKNGKTNGNGSNGNGSNDNGG